MIEVIDSAFAIVTSTLIPMAFALCFFYFVWGVAKYIRTSAAGNDATKEAKKVMVSGIIGLFIAFSIWGIIKFIQNELGIPGIEVIDKPAIEN